MVQLGLRKLEKYIREGEPILLFKECAEEGESYLTKRQFNRFLMATEIQELSDRDIRKALNKKLFSYYPSGKMIFEDFLILFHLKKQEPTQKQ